jgi:glycosyltransferase involved in cell wall biosynthesis
VPDVTFLVAVHNRRDRVRRAIASVPLADEQVEVVVVDDASTDGSADAVVETFGDRVVLLRLERNRGAGAARNAGARIATGDWVLVLDSDNALLPGAIDVVRDAIARWGDEAAVFQFGSITAAGRALGRKTFPDGIVDHRAILLREMQGEYCVMVRRDALLDTPYNEWPGRDNSGVTWMQIARVHGMAVVDTPVLTYDDTSPDRLSDRRRAVDDPDEAARCHRQLLEIFGGELEEQRPDLWGEHLATAAFFEMLSARRRSGALADVWRALRRSRRRPVLVAGVGVLAGPRLGARLYAGRRT